MVCQEGRIAIKCFVSTVLLFSTLFLFPININTFIVYQYHIFINPLLFYIAINIILRIFFCKGYQIAVRAGFLGQIFGLGFYVFQYAPAQVYIFGIYMAIMSFFHYSEYLTIAIIKPKELTTKSFMLSHSPAYIGAALTSWIEFGLESYFFPDIKVLPYVPYIGLIICIGGEMVRKLAMFTAAKNFDHLVQYTKADDHTLVTHGIYSWCRHPSYVGWFYWSIGTQIILLNPICIIVYTIISWMFFNERIHCEEITLLNFFGQQYLNYQEDVGTGLPFIKGYIVRP